MGVDRSTYSYYESGKIKPDIYTIMRMSKIFNVHYTNILESEENNRLMDSFGETLKKKESSKNQTSTLNLNALTEKEQEMIIAFRMLTKESQQYVTDVLNERFKNGWDGKLSKK